MDSENVEETGGVIPYKTGLYGLNPGQYFEDFLKKLPPDTELLFLRPLCPAAKRNGRLPWIPVWYEKRVVGASNIGFFMQKLTEGMGIPKLTNSQIRRSTIEKFAFNKIESRKIAMVSGHKNLKTL